MTDLDNPLLYPIDRRARFPWEIIFQVDRDTVTAEQVRSAYAKIHSLAWAESATADGIDECLQDALNYIEERT